MESELIVSELTVKVKVKMDSQGNVIGVEVDGKPVQRDNHTLDALEKKVNESLYWYVNDLEVIGCEAIAESSKRLIELLKQLLALIYADYAEFRECLKGWADG